MAAPLATVIKSKPIHPCFIFSYLGKPVESTTVKVLKRVLSERPSVRGLNLPRPKERGRRMGKFSGHG